MPVDPDSYKQDSRSPQELAKAILDHVVKPPRDTSAYTISFRERLLMDYQAPLENHVFGTYGEPLVLMLKAMEEGQQPDSRDRESLRHALLVTDAYKKELAGFRADAIREVNEAFADPESKPPSYYQRKDAEDIEDCTVEIMNYNSIEKLVRSLADKLGVSLIEATRKK